MTARTTLVALAIVVHCAACGSKAVFGLTSDDNNADALARALGRGAAAGSPEITNATGSPLIVAVVSGPSPRLVAWDAAAAKVRWTVAADVQSRVAVAGALVVAREGAALVVREVRDGAVRASISAEGDLVGAATDGDGVYAVWRRGGSGPPTWRLAAYAADGKRRWHNDAAGALGVPAVRGGLVLAPFLKQWLAVLDARTGAQLTRVRGVDAEIGFVRATSDAAWFGSKAGIFRLDARAAAGTRAGATFGAATLPAQLAQAGYAPDAYDPVQASYSAFDRRRVLWRADPRGEGFRFTDDVVAVHHFRFVFGLTPAGEVRWAYAHPRAELVASAHLGPAIVAVAADGAVVRIDPATGAVRTAGRIDVDGPILGATIDGDGWSPDGAGEPPATAAALVTIVRDRDARFADIKQLALTALARLRGPEVTRELLAVIADPGESIALRDAATDLLIGRKDVADLPALVAGLAPRYDFIAGTAPVAVSAAARALANLGGLELAASDRTDAVIALATQLEDPATPALDRVELVRALIALGQGAERSHLRSLILVERADPALARELALAELVLRALASGAALDREAVTLVATDARSVPAVAELARAALATP